ncbi:MAG: hypothetical protein A2725_01050 [Candidatus Magasanikbacteria bacterium RIFCSPHIGHO2_01_FULL_33_34]|uniref:NAD-dependent epimerase/dehydratase domain-containing protein n=1 Tax=Candidatus Magasanikbacteria bacterium RIFCSPHIGHO2_01_FULL_33_34 TaxID=1798671 RepID=A0A1F6LJ23_9BACT|nr:MAG: hypothetical protein A2725_01050 [Candidatus Magasanikbacteria bacterium RIFCSPHIGHO2_01_FULL_33_34]OGH65342.1 MAG: hypothetical protein A3B83_04710 [Candidatus Magasanikbacteria bacterium RIFCSPHIGHO2_02_FULL_33_17]OGH76118.1 MAG: hypothetical protein A3A89_01630 [Candidatus Magasanikbacteria bacterium RIFCSPLOWO2_01_FULL_33_34]OGH81080.1 MAG: hypothetical protein A3F93_02870 [Candidatus Magasanikbacteria bacterium RIFCSPLOWO2_12_FULL_34_7]
MSNSNKKILVTGGAGFIGSHLVERLVSEGYDVNILIKETTDTWRIEHILDKVNLHYVSLLDKNSLESFVNKLKPYGVFHLAASNIASGVTAGDEDVLNTNILGFKNLVDSLKDIDYNFFVNTGSFMEYGPKQYPVKESDLCEPTELYSISKLSATLYGQAVAKTSNKPIITFRLFTPYGPKIQKGRLVYEVVKRALDGRDIEITNKDVSRDFIYVGDLVDLYMSAIDSAKNNKGGIFNAGSGKAVQLGELVKIVMNLTGSKSNINWGERPLLDYDSKLWQADMENTFKNFNWKPKYSLEAGLKEVINYLKK